MEPKASVPAREVKGIAVGAGIEYTTDVGDSHNFSMCDQTTKHWQTSICKVWRNYPAMCDMW